MTNPIGLAAEVAGFPKEDNMADVIDALKRLERVGDENSKTNQKLLDAAKSLSSLIAEQFAVREGEQAEIVFRDVRYRVLLGEGQIGSQGGLTVRPIGKTAVLERERVFVAKNRDVATEFAKDISQGLLEEIHATLQKRQAESREALSLIEDAASKLRKR